MKNKTLIIAEAGVNHNGQIDLAKELISAAKECGADVVKFQTWVTEELVNKDAPLAAYQKIHDSGTQFQMLKNLELSFDHFRELNNFAAKTGIRFLSTPDEEISLNFLVDELKMETIKVGSGEITNLPYLQKIGAKQKEVILSTGMAGLGEVELALSALINSGAKKVTLLHCTSAYPAPANSVNLKAMITLQEAFKTEVGYSDHTIGSEVSVAAVALGAKIIEKHFTLDKKMKGPDHAASANPAEFQLLVNQIRNVEQALSGTGKKTMQPIEHNTKFVVTKGAYAATNLPAGHRLTLDDLKFLRPAHEGINAGHYGLVLGKELAVDINKGEKIFLSQLKL